MTRADDELAITGIGMISPIGGDAEATMESLLRGKSGVTLLPEDQRSLTPVYLHAPVDDAALTRVTKPESFRFDRSVHLALQAAREAWEDAGSPAVDPARLAVLFGAGMGGLLKAISTQNRFQARGYTGFPANTVPGLMPNASAALIALDLGAHGGAVSLSGACAAGAEAIAHALRLFRTDEIDVAVAGGTEAIIHPLTLTSFAALRALSARHHDPAGASRPFDRDRDGFVLGEGAGVLVIERRRHAVARAARIWGTLLGAGQTCNASHVIAPDPDGRWSAEAAQRALRSAGLGPADVTIISAHATATADGDLAEYRALRAVFGHHLPGARVTAVKSAMGHTIGASGAIAAGLGALSLHQKVVPPTQNVEVLDPEIELDIVRGAPQAISGGGVAMINAYAFGGHNVSLLIGGS